MDMGTIATMAPAYGLKVNQILFDKLRIFEAACLGIWNPQGCTKQKKEHCALQHGEFLDWACGNCPEKKGN